MGRVAGARDAPARPGAPDPEANAAAMIEIPCQIVRSGRRLAYRLLSWNPWQGVFLRLVELSA